MSWRLARSLVQLSDEVRARWPGITIWSIGDAAHRNRASDHNPNSAGVVCAVDVVDRVAAGWLWDHLRRNRDPRIAYLIHDGRIVSATSSPWTVRPYTGSNPHTNHIHISVGRGPDGAKGQPDLYDARTEWGITAVSTQEDDVLKRGDKGPQVSYFQRRIRECGQLREGRDLLPKYGPDGDFGGETEDAVKVVQGYVRFEQTGVIDLATGVYIQALAHSAKPHETSGGGLSQEDADGRYVKRGTTVRLP